MRTSCDKKLASEMLTAVYIDLNNYDKLKLVHIKYKYGHRRPMNKQSMY